MMMNRRNFMKFSAKGMILLGGLSFIQACSGFKRSDLDRLKDQQQSIKGLEKDGMEILALASLAPSGHNTQPWTVKIMAPNHWMIGSEKKRWLPAVDPENREMLLGIGAVLENLVLAAGTFGYSVEVKIIAKNRTDTDIADIRLKKDKPQEFPLEKLKRRRTVRSNFIDQEVQGEDLKYITKHDTRPCLVQIPSPHSFYVPNNSPQDKYLQEGTIEANRAQAFRDPAMPPARAARSSA